MTRQFWRTGLLAALLAALLAGLTAAFSLSSTLYRPHGARAAGQPGDLKTTEEPLDPACNALGKLQVNVSPSEREEFNDENGGLIKACRYDVELVNTDDTYSIRVFTNGSGSIDRGEAVYHTRHGHRSLDPGESYRRSMYVIIYPDSSEESFFYTYLKATYSDLDFPKDCRPMIDHLYTWDLPYRLLEAPCMDLSLNPPELVEWTPPEGLVEAGDGIETGSAEAGGAETGGAETGGAESGGAVTGETLSEDQQLAAQGGDLMSQLIELLTLGDLGSLDQWQGWSGLTDTQRANLLAIIARLDQRASEYIPPSQLALLNETERQEALAQQREDQLAQRLAERVQAWERLDMLINRERARDKGDWALWLYDNYRASQLLTGAYNEMRSWFDRLSNREDWAKDKAIEYLQENSGTSVDEAAVEIMKETASLANSPVRTHYAYYLEYYNPYRQQGLSHEDAHLLAMEDLRVAANQPPQAGGGILNDDIWLSQNFTDMAASGGIYDRVFDNLKGNYDPGVTP